MGYIIRFVKENSLITFITLSMFKKGLKFISLRTDFCKGEKLYFCWRLLVEMTLAKRYRREPGWSEEIVLFLKECSIVATKFSLDGLERREKFNSWERTSRWDLVRVCEERLITEFWIIGETGKANKLELRRAEKFLSKITVWVADL